MFEKCFDLFNFMPLFLPHWLQYHVYRREEPDGVFSLFFQYGSMEFDLIQGAKDKLSEVVKKDYSSISFVFFQMTFVATAASVISGALAERVKLWSFFIFVAFLASFVYPIQGAWSWGGGWLARRVFMILPVPLWFIQWEDGLP